MPVVPWSQVRSWWCNNCGICCRHYDVVLKFPEWLNIVKNFGPEYTATSIDKFLLRRKISGSCAFLRETPTLAFCNLQLMKPQACKLWPFKVLDRPRYGRAAKAAYHFAGRRLFIYTDIACTGLRFGVPTRNFSYTIIPEFIELALGWRRTQFKTTAIL